jgi:sodium/potassium-transporting ATPase subunit alpha
MAGKGQRVIACAMLKLPQSEFSRGYVFTTDAFPDKDLVFLGLVGLQDPPKPGTHLIMK